MCYRVRDLLVAVRRRGVSTLGDGGGLSAGARARASPRLFGTQRGQLQHKSIGEELGILEFD